MPTCPFCAIPRTHSDIILAQNASCYLIDNPEGALQHGMLVIPFRHVDSPFALTTEEWMDTHPLVLHSQELLAMHNPDGFNLGWNVGRTGGQEVAHVHLHVIARFADEPFAGAGIRRWLKSDANRRDREDV